MDLMSLRQENERLGFYDSEDEVRDVPFFYKRRTDS